MEDPPPQEVLEFWVETSDENTGKTYYYHSTTFVAVWERPSGLVVPEAELVDPSEVKDGEDASVGSGVRDKGVPTRNGAAPSPPTVAPGATESSTPSLHPRKPGGEEERKAVSFSPVHSGPDGKGSLTPTRPSAAPPPEAVSRPAPPAVDIPKPSALEDRRKASPLLTPQFSQRFPNFAKSVSPLHLPAADLASRDSPVSHLL